MKNWTTPRNLVYLITVLYTIQLSLRRLTGNRQNREVGYTAITLIVFGMTRSCQEELRSELLFADHVPSIWHLYWKCYLKISSMDYF